MNKREAKRLACRIAANLIDETNIYGAHDAISRTDDHNEVLSEADAERVQAALNELVTEMDVRGEGRRRRQRR